MIYTAASTPGSPDTPSEDWYAVTSGLVIVLDGATIRTETGCVHGAAWYVRELGTAIVHQVTRQPSLRRALACAIQVVNARHPECDLTHPGTPSAAAGIVYFQADKFRYLVLGDITLALETDYPYSNDGAVAVISDPRVSATAAQERKEADRWPIGSAQKDAALIPMKHAELAARNVAGGYWIAAVDPSAADHALTGELPASHVRRFALLTDGAARYVDLFNLGTWPDVLDALRHGGPAKLIDTVRSVEDHDPLGVRYPRNKRHDDATVVSAQPTDVAVDEPLLIEERQELIVDLLTRVNDPSIMGERRRA